MALSDRYKGKSSPYGIEVTYLPLGCATSVSGSESNDKRRSASRAVDGRRVLITSSVWQRDRGE